MNVSPLLRELIIHACAFGKLNTAVAGQKRVIGLLRDQLQAAHSVALQLPRPADARAKRIVDTLLADPADERTLARLCNDCGASKRTIQRLFLEETKMTFGRWRQQLRLLHGLQLGESHRGGARRRLQQPQRVHLDVPQPTRHHAGPLFWCV